MHSTATSVLLQQRITLPTPAFRDMVNSQRDRAAASVSSPTQPRAAAPPAPPSQPPQPAAGYVDPVTVRDPAKRVPPRTGSLSDARVPTTTYVNSVSVFVATNPDNDRVALMMCGRFLPDSKKASDEYNGRTVERWSVYDSVLSASSDTVGAMGGAGGGVVCSSAKSKGVGVPTVFTKPHPGKIALVQSCVPAVTDVPAWISLRASFMDLRVDSTSTPGAASHSSFTSFNLDDVDDDLVRMAGEMAARLRTEKCLAEVGVSESRLHWMMRFVLTAFPVTKSRDGDA